MIFCCCSPSTPPGPTTPLCQCNVPTTLALTVSNAGMSGGIVYTAATLTYSALDLGLDIFLANNHYYAAVENYPDAMWSGWLPMNYQTGPGGTVIGPIDICYILSCIGIGTHPNGPGYILQAFRRDPTADTSNPYIYSNAEGTNGGALFTWPIPMAGNSCSPFLLSAGTTRSGHSGTSPGTDPVFRASG